MATLDKNDPIMKMCYTKNPNTSDIQSTTAKVKSNPKKAWLTITSSDKYIFESAPEVIIGGGCCGGLGPLDGGPKS
eukprot:scaffold313690_cov24-Attheya_sp.AAC.1